MKIEICNLCGRKLASVEEEIRVEHKGYAGCLYTFNPPDYFYVKDGKILPGGCGAAEIGPMPNLFAVSVCLESAEEDMSICVRCRHKIIKAALAKWNGEARRLCRCSLPKKEEKEKGVNDGL